MDWINGNHCDIVGLTETHIKPTDTESFISELTPPNYKLWHVPQKYSTGGGVGLLIRNSFMAKSLDTIEIKSFEYLMLSVCLPNHNVNVVVIYRPPASSTAVFLDEFMSLSAYLHTLKSDYLLLGDFNIHIDTDSALTTKFNAILDSCNMRQPVNFPTHIHGHTLDLVITSSDCP